MISEITDFTELNKMYIFFVADIWDYGNYKIYELNCNFLSHIHLHYNQDTTH